MDPPKTPLGRRLLPLAEMVQSGDYVLGVSSFSYPEARRVLPRSRCPQVLEPA
jgi:hypothetical protein